MAGGDDHNGDRAGSTSLGAEKQTPREDDQTTTQDKTTNALPNPLGSTGTGLQRAPTWQVGADPFPGTSAKARPQERPGTICKVSIVSIADSLCLISNAIKFEEMNLLPAIWMLWTSMPRDAERVHEQLENARNYACKIKQTLDAIRLPLGDDHLSKANRAMHAELTQRFTHIWDKIHTMHCHMRNSLAPPETPKLVPPPLTPRPPSFPPPSALLLARQQAKLPEQDGSAAWEAHRYQREKDETHRYQRRLAKERHIQRILRQQQQELGNWNANLCRMLQWSKQQHTDKMAEEIQSRIRKQEIHDARHEIERQNQAKRTREERENRQHAIAKLARTKIEQNALIAWGNAHDPDSLLASLNEVIMDEGASEPDEKLKAFKVARDAMKTTMGDCVGGPHEAKPTTERREAEQRSMDGMVDLFISQPRTETEPFEIR